MKMLYIFAAATLFLGLNELRGQSEFDASQDISGTYIRYQVRDQVASTCNHDHEVDPEPAAGPFMFEFSRISDTEYVMVSDAGQDIYTVIGDQLTFADEMRIPLDGFYLEISGKTLGVIGSNNIIYGRVEITVDSDAPEMAIASYPYFGTIPCQTVFHQMFVRQ